jgi:hypothetical protein
MVVIIMLQNYNYYFRAYHNENGNDADLIMILDDLAQSTIINVLSKKFRN